MNRLVVSLIGILIPCCLLFGQGNYQVAIAEKGDGIFSILRKQGLDPVKYYAEFIALNEKNIKDGSRLHLNQEYLIPNAPDSFKKTGLKVPPEKKEKSIFETELASISAKSDKLKNAVIYLISSESTNGIKSTKKTADEITLLLARELMVHGAKVYLIESSIVGITDFENKPKPIYEGNIAEQPMAALPQMQEYVEEINKRFLKHQGKYQRLLITRVNDYPKNKKWDVSVYHHEKSENGRNIARNIQQVFNQNRIESKSFKEYTEVFSAKNNLYLAKNALPAITLIDIGSTSDRDLEKRITVRSDKATFTNLIASGVLNDYADLGLEE